MNTVKGHPVNRIQSIVSFPKLLILITLIGLLTNTYKATAENFYHPASQSTSVIESMIRYPTFFNPPLSTTHSWEMATYNFHLGLTMDGDMDVNGDGFGDFVAGSYNSRNGSLMQAGYVNLHLGSAGGVAGSPWELLGTDNDMQLGYRVAGAGDVNNDGYDDVLIMALMYNNPGAVRLYMGHAGGLSTTPAWTRSPFPTPNSYYGWVTSRAGDLNGDGYGDIVISSPNAVANKGVVEVFYGNASGIPTTPSWTVNGDVTNAYFGGSVTAADVNGDGFNDLIVGAPFSSTAQLSTCGRVFIYYGSASGLSLTANQSYVGTLANERLGDVVKSCGDVNNDGFDDVAISHEIAYEKFLSFYYGSATGLNTTPSLRIQASYQTFNAFESRMISHGDFNADGCSDVVLGCQSCLSSTGKSGVVSIYFGKPEGLQSTPAWKIENTTKTYYYLGRALNSAGDVNGDGYTDLLVSIREMFYLGSADRHSLSLFTGGTIALPVTLASFSYQCNNNKPQLAWRTETEMNTDRFEIEQSSNGNNWTVIGSVKALGTAQGARDYRFEPTHNPPAQYRLKMIDLDGAVSYSKILNIRNSCDGDKQFTWTLNPNPAKSGDKLQINITNYPYNVEPVKVQLTDLKGYRQLLKTMTIPRNSVLYMTDVSLPSMLPAGAYILSIGNSQFRESRRVLVSK